MADAVFSVEVLPARKGDCLLLHWGSADDPGLGLIDGGPSGVYGPTLRPRLEALGAGLPPGRSLTLDFVMLSHIDDDHAKGLIDLFQQLVDAKRAQKQPLTRPLGLWHNTFDDIVGNTAEELCAAVTARYGTASLTGDLPADAVPADVDPSVAADVFKILASVDQGRTLRDFAKFLDLPLNAGGGGALVVAAPGAQPVPMGRGLTLTVVGPMHDEVDALHQQHDAWIQAQRAKGRPLPDALASYVDVSVTNLSSIVVLAECGGRTILFTGDARGDRILAGLELVGAITAGGSLEVDVLKVPHHGSSNNVEQSFFERIHARHYVFSGDGENGNPERETLEMLAAARPDGDYAVYLTYEVADIDVEREKDWNKERAKQVKRGSGVRDPWSAQVNSLASFLDANPTFKARIAAVQGNPAHRIDLAGDGQP